MGKPNAIWITWEQQRRSIELSRAFRAKLYVFKETPFLRSHPIMRYFVLSIKSIKAFIENRPKIVFVQNPSIVLADLACLCKSIFKFRLVVDRHSNFKLHTLTNRKIKWRLFHFLSKYSIKHADLTIVTNDFLYQLVNSWRGHAFILQDRLPDMALSEKIRLNGAKNIVVISTFSEDEPINEVIEAARFLDGDWTVYITGNYAKYKDIKDIMNRLPKNVVLTGFLPDGDYKALLKSADLIVTLTTQEHTLVCGAYEATVLCKPMILSETETIKNYFNKGVIYTRNDKDSITGAVKNAFANYDLLSGDIIKLKNELLYDWNKRYEQLCNLLAETQ